MSFDSEQARLVDRIQACAFFQAREAGATFITKAWVAKKLKRSEDWVKKHWRKDPMDCFSDHSNAGRPESLSQESKDIIEAGIGLQRKSCRNLAKEILLRQVRQAQGGHTQY